VKVTQNLKCIAGASIVLTASAFYLVSFLTLDHVPFAVFATYLASLVIGGAFVLFGNGERKKATFPTTD
jgi:hypothetical protein